MSLYLLDTSVLSLLAPGRHDATPEFLAWVQSRNEELHVSSVSVAEIEQGIAKLRRAGGTRSPNQLDLWLQSTMTTFADRVLPFDVVSARAAGRLADAATANGYRPGIADLYIAATAHARGMQVLTRNLKHFDPLGVDCLDPLVTLPS